MIAELAIRLRGAGLTCTLEELSDILWLAARLPACPSARAAPEANAQPVAVGAPTQETDAAPRSARDGTARTEASGTGQSTSLYAAQQRGSMTASVLRVPGVSANPRPDDLRHALQPFSRRMPSRWKSRVDEEATAVLAADFGVWLPVYQAERERWFDLTLLAEESEASNLWSDTLLELARMFRSQGRFRSVSLFHLDTEGGKQQLISEGGKRYGITHLGRFKRPQQVLLATDATSHRWRSGAIQRFAHAAGAFGAISILQLLPRRAWRHTVLGEPELTLFALRAGVRNACLYAVLPWWIDEADAPGALRVPLIALDAEGIGRWAHAMSGRRGVGMPGVLLDAKPEAPANDPTSLTPSECIARFRGMVSRPAYELAVFLAVADPLTIPVMRLVQRTMLPATSNAELAEFFLGGLIRQVEVHTIKTGHHGERAYRFLDGVRDALMRSLRYSEEATIRAQLRRVGKFIEQQGRGGSAFPAYFPVPGGPMPLVPWALPFAELSSKILMRWAHGGAHEVAADGSPVPSGASALTCLAYMPDGVSIVTGDAGGNMRLWAAGTGTPVSSDFPVHGAQIDCIAVSPDGDSIVSGGRDRLLRICDASALLQSGSFLGRHDNWIMGAAFSPDGARVASASLDNSVRLWTINASAPAVVVLTGHTDSVFSVAFSPDGQLVVSGGADRTVRIWNALSGAPVAVLTGHTDAVTSVATSPDGKACFSGSLDGSLRGWNMQTGEQLALMRTDDANRIWCVGVSADGGFVASGSWDKSVHVWCTGTGHAAHAPRQLPAHVTAIAFSPDAWQLAVTMFDGSMTLLDTPKGEVGHIVEASGLLSTNERIVDALLIRSTPMQQQWLVASSRAMFVVLDSATTRANGQMVQEVAAGPDLLTVVVSVSEPDSPSIRFGSNTGQRWPYSPALFPTPALLVKAVRALVEGAGSYHERGTPAARMAQSDLEITVFPGEMPLYRVMRTGYHPLTARAGNAHDTFGAVWSDDGTEVPVMYAATSVSACLRSMFFHGPSPVSNVISGDRIRDLSCFTLRIGRPLRLVVLTAAMLLAAGVTPTNFFGQNYANEREQVINIIYQSPLHIDGVAWHSDITDADLLFCLFANRMAEDNIATEAQQLILHEELATFLDDTGTKILF